ncbi:MAG: phasin family protein [Gammaproteobacteria bacterium]|uniref:phasin family protein n=1 Tax=Pseudomaricurvus alcaniphilus TaxID=1166482 RepID=UPI00140E9594|nr:phasin family protein [Pseudomaricurvus alcaniphilus]MBR9910111.1 phasin family protein [Gammaproteobacteria bacterium]NHN36627.1 phasin family protein [Pseudomaricurvus alcaniphilus]
MSDPKDTKKAHNKTEEIGRRIWLAGLGAYGQSYDNVQNSVEKINNESRSYFEKLVARGEELENQTRKTLHETRENAVKKTNSKIREQKEKLASQAEKLQKFSLDSLSLDKLKPDMPSLENLTDTINGRLDDIRSRINDLLPGMATREDIQALSEKIDKLAANTRGSRAKKPAAPKAPDSEQPDSK